MLMSFNNNEPINICRYTGRTETELSFYHLPVVLLMLKRVNMYIVQITGRAAAAQRPDRDYVFKEGAHLANI